MYTKSVFTVMYDPINADFFRQPYKELRYKKIVNLEGLVSLGYYSMFTNFYPIFANNLIYSVKRINLDEFDNCTVCV